MGRSIIVLANCDNCGVRGDESLFEMDCEISVTTITGTKPVLIDLCTDLVVDGSNCLRQFKNAISVWTDKAHAAEKPRRGSGGSSVSPPTGNNNGPVCYEPGCDKGPKNGPFVAKSEMGLVMHKSKSHGIPGASAESQRRHSQLASV